MKTQLKSLSLGLILLLLSLPACTRAPSGKNARFSMTLPGSQKRVSSKSWGPALPESLSQINCYVVMIEGPEATMRDNLCKDSNGAVVASPGMVFGGYSPNTSIELEVSPGERSIYIVGVETVSPAACLAFRTTTKSSDYSAPAIVAKAKLQLVPGLNNVTLTASLSGAQQIDSCVGPDFPQPEMSTDEPLWIVGGGGVVHSSLVHNNKLYLGGAFVYVGPHNGFSAELSAVDGHRLPEFNSFRHKVMGDVNVAIPDGNGGWFIGGDFLSVGLESRLRLARIKADGSAHAWQPSDYPDGPVHALAIANGKLYVGGGFSSVGSVTKNGLVAYDLTSGALSAWDPDLGSNSPTVLKLVADSTGSLYIAGMFDDVGGIPRYGAAKFNASGALTPWDPSTNGYVMDLVLSRSQADRVYLCGAFNLVGGTVRSLVASVDASLGAVQAFDASVPIDTGVCQSLAEDSNGNVFVGGVNLAMSTDPSMNSGPYKLSSSGLVDTSFNLMVDGDVTRMLFAGGRLYFGGGFHYVDGQERHGLAAVSTTGILTPWTSSLAGVPSALAMQLGRVFIGAKMAGSIGGAYRSNFAAIDLTTGRATDMDYRADDVVYTLSLVEGNLLLGGSFTDISGEMKSGFAQVDLTTGTLHPNIGSTAQIGSLEPGAGVRSLVADSNYIYVGTTSMDLDGDPTHAFLFRVGRNTGSLDTSWIPEPDGAVHSLAIDGNSLYAAGAFGSWISGAIGQVVKVNKDDLTSDASFVSPGFDGEISHLFLNGGKVYVTGSFMNVDVDPSSYLTRLDAVSGAYDDAWLSDLDGPVEHLEFVGNHVYVAGSFTAIGGQGRDGVVRMSLSNTAFTDDPAFLKDGGPGNSVFGVSFWNNRLILTGNDYLSADQAGGITHVSPGILPVTLTGSYYYPTP